MLRFTHFLRQYFGDQSCYKAILDFMQLCWDPTSVGWTRFPDCCIGWAPRSPRWCLIICYSNGCAAVWCARCHVTLTIADTVILSQLTVSITGDAQLVGCEHSCTAAYRNSLQVRACGVTGLQRFSLQSNREYSKGTHCPLTVGRNLKENL